MVPEVPGETLKQSCLEKEVAGAPIRIRGRCHDGLLRTPFFSQPSGVQTLSLQSLASNQLIHCRNHIWEFKENMLRLKNKSENNHQNLMQVLDQVKHKTTHSEKSSEGTFLSLPVNTLSEEEALPSIFDCLRFFLPHLRTAGKVYPDIAIGKGRAGVSFALGITTIDRGNYTYLKQTLTSVLSRMTPAEEKDSVVIVSVPDTDEGYLKSVIDMVKTKFKRQVQSGSLEVISIPTFFYPSVLLEKKTYKVQESWQIKQVLDFCILMLYAQPKATYYLQLEDDIIAKQKYFTQIRQFVNSLASKKWFYIEFSAVGFIGKLFRSKDLTDFVHFFLMFHKVKPIDMLLDDVFLVKLCNWGEPLKACLKRKREVKIQYRPSLFQHVGTHSSLPGRMQYLKGGRAADGSRAAVELAARAPGPPQHPPARPLAHAQLAVAAGRLPAGSVWGDAGDRVAASRTPELPLLDTNPQDRCVDRGQLVLWGRGEESGPDAGQRSVLRLDGSAGCGQVRL
ncbi:alpha-1,3-mannosyl-glycoprotein 4-beta-N-acetylglucosaminyltransferase-like protein MGAT4D [Acomys russatus]|uniref:alpha-1,3-mannosyl-glycoprotein 4-beta-N-acetylglucosaminyltransferase-like protein MGAT4D n=1 Tax=Acomys russatus TaxID=60746 RepID=UPI0021E319C4|nr:alpha-1,3-mannosyl-glycoprotein 4-beta-N-acetylglucosaminyltransferase-like protein MGAT4D [Acomys russatus]